MWVKPSQLVVKRRSWNKRKSKDSYVLDAGETPGPEPPESVSKYESVSSWSSSWRNSCGGSMPYTLTLTHICKERKTAKKALERVGFNSDLLVAAGEDFEEEKKEYPTPPPPPPPPLTSSVALVFTFITATTEQIFLDVLFRLRV